MKQIVTTSANYLAVILDGKLIPEIEVGITTSEMDYGFTLDGVIKSRKCETLRISGDPTTLRTMAAGLVDFADDCEDKFNQATSKKESQ